MKILSICQLSSLAKTFPNRIFGKEIRSENCAKGQQISYQVAYRGEKRKLKLNIESELKEYITLYNVGFVPMTLPTYNDCTDEDYLTKEKGDCPDPLYPMEKMEIFVEDEYKSLWVNIDVPNDIEAGEYSIIIEFLENGKVIEKSHFGLNVHNLVLPEQAVYFTQWFHTDCIANVHNVSVFSKEHWRLIELYVKLAVGHGMNMILTPVLTPPLDTEVGGERTTVQLVDIEKTENAYKFDFTKLERFIEICLKSGIKFFEINHMFTQWGAKNAPKVIARVDGEEKRIFGWETEATSQEYASFLNQLVPLVIKAFEKKGVSRSKLFFHISDEPSFEHLENYKNAHSLIESLIEGCNQMDALSHYDFYEQGIVETPVVAIDSITPFLDAGVKNLWCYYCCAQHSKVANKFMAMPSYRNRIIGVQMYIYSIVGFLHWGYNFYNLQYSKGQIDPYQVTDAGGAFPSGDSFSVYPYKDGVIPSLRQKVFKNALDDIRLLTLLEKKIGKQSVVDLIEDVAGMKITFSDYPQNDEFFERLYDGIFKLLND